MIKHLLAIDVGNTEITLGLYQGHRLRHTWRLQTHHYHTSDELGIAFLQLLRAQGLTPQQIAGVVAASVVPSMDSSLREGCRLYLRRSPLLVDSNVELGIKNLYRNPQEVGADRLVNAVAIHQLVKGPAIVVDFGTATTFDCVSQRGEYLGGVIAPGLAIANESLAEKTAKLPRVVFAVPQKVLGKTTRESLQSGLFWGYIGLVEGILKRLEKEMQGKPTVVATGGLSSVIGPRVSAIRRVVPTLTLDGLRLIYERNH